MRVSLVAVLLAAAVAGAWQEGAPVRIGVYSTDYPYAYIDEAGGLTGSGPGLARAVCDHAGLQCELVPLGTLTDRIPSLQNGSVDALFASLAVTPEREELVDFLRPFYDASDISIISLQDGAAALAAAGAWQGIRGKPVCTLAGNFAIGIISERFAPVIVEAASGVELVDKLLDGSCIAAVDGSYGLDLMRLALERHNASLVLVDAGASVAPNAAGAAVAKGEGNSELAQRLTAGLVAAASKGNASELLQLEEEFLTPAGIPPNAALRRLVQALTSLV